MNIKLKKIQIYEGYSIMAVQCYFCEMPAETFSQNNEPVCGKHAQQSVELTGEAVQVVGTVTEMSGKA